MRAIAKSTLMCPILYGYTRKAHHTRVSARDFPNSTVAEPLGCSSFISTIVRIHALGAYIWLSPYALTQGNTHLPIFILRLKKRLLFAFLSKGSLSSLHFSLHPAESTRERERERGVSLTHILVVAI